MPLPPSKFPVPPLPSPATAPQLSPPAHPDPLHAASSTAPLDWTDDPVLRTSLSLARTPPPTVVAFVLPVPLPAPAPPPADTLPQSGSIPSTAAALLPSATTTPRSAS